MKLKHQYIVVLTAAALGAVVVFGTAKKSEIKKPKADITGGLGFRFGDKLNGGNGDKDGGYAAEIQTTNKPFESVTVFANQNHEIYSITSSSADASADWEIRKVLIEKYGPGERGNDDRASWIKWASDDHKRELKLTWYYKSSSLLSIEYMDWNTANVLFDAMHKKEEQTAQALKGTL
jgi:hypothetical protein